MQVVLFMKKVANLLELKLELLLEANLPSKQLYPRCYFILETIFIKNK